MYQILCDNEIIYDPRIDGLTVLEPKCSLEANTVGEASFDMLPDHPYYNKLKPLKSVFEIRQDGYILFRGRMTNHSRELYNRLSVDLEGILAVTNGSFIPPFSFPDDFDLPAEKNVVEVLLSWIIEKHNEQVQPWQQLKIGAVSVTDPNNVIVRSSEKYISTWEALKTKLFDSSLGGKLVVRYETDGNYIDYVSTYPLTNAQHITLGKNILELQRKDDGQETYSAILPAGAEDMLLDRLPDEDITPDFVKQGVFIYSRQAVEAYGWACAPISDTTWDDVTEVTNLRRKAVQALSDMVQLNTEITVTALDLNFTDTQVQSLRPFRNVIVESPANGIDAEVYPLDKISIDLVNPQDTKITVGKTQKTLADSASKWSDAAKKSEKTAQLVEGVNQKVESLGKNTVSSVTVEYYLSTSEAKPTGGEWQTDIEWAEGKYTWSRTKTIDGHGRITYAPSTNGICIASGKSQKGADGRGIAVIVNYYLASAADTGITTESPGWTEEIQTIFKDKKYLWNYEVIKYTDNSTPTETMPCIIGVYGADGAAGVGITSITEHYAVSKSNSTIPDTWQSSVPALTKEYKYLWNYETITYSSGNHQDTAKRIIGVYGDAGDPGRSVVSIIPEYYLSTSKTAQEGGQWAETQPAWEDGKYIWTRSKVTYANPEGVEYTTPVCDSSWEAVQGQIGEIKQEMVDLETNMSSTAQAIVLSALANYVKTGDYESFQETVNSQLSILADEIIMKFTTTIEQVNKIDGDVQSRFETLSKCIKYAGDTAISIGSGDSTIVLELDNEKGIAFKKNGVAFGYWDGVDFHTGNIVVEVNERAQFGDFAWVPRSDGSLMFLKVSGVTEDAPELDIIREPASITVYAGKTFSFSLEAVGDNVRYQWQENAGSGWHKIENATAKSYSGVAAAAYDGYRYRCIVEDDSGDSMESSAAVLSVKS